MKVLVADDDVLVRYTLHRILTDAGHEADEARDGRTVLESLKGDAPEVLVLDLVMPGMTGYEILRWLKTHDPERRIAVIVLSAFVAELGELEAHPHVVAVLQKPIYVNQLFEALRLCADRDVVAA
jgi:CheY-like chemotaxis protein